MANERLLKSFLQSLLSESAEVDNVKVDQIIQYVIDNDVPLEIRVIRPQTIGVGFPKETFVKEIAERLGISDEEVDIYLNKAMNKIAKVIALKLHENKEPTTELEKQIIDKFYNEDLKIKLTLKMSPIIPIYETSKVAEGTIKIDEEPIKYYALQITYDRAGNGDLENFFIALTKKELIDLIKLLQEAVKDAPENSL